MQAEPMAQTRATVISGRCSAATNLRFSQFCCYNTLVSVSHTKPAHILVSLSSRSILFPAAPQAPPPQSLVLQNLIKFRFQLNAQYFISIVMFLYMFRALLCPSSGGPLYIHNIWFYVSLFW